MAFVIDDLAIALAVLSAGADIAGGFAAKSAAENAARQYERNAQLAKIGADQVEVARRRDFASTISSINAIRAARGLDVTSPTGLAISQRLERDLVQSLSADRLNSWTQARAFEEQAAAERNRGHTSLLTGFLKAGSSPLPLLSKGK